MTKNHADNDETMLVQLNGEQGNLTIMLGGVDGTTLIKAKSGMIHMAVDGGGSLTSRLWGAFLVAFAPALLAWPALARIARRRAHAWHFTPRPGSLRELEHLRRVGAI